MPVAFPKTPRGDIAFRCVREASFHIWNHSPAHRAVAERGFSVLRKMQFGHNPNTEQEFVEAAAAFLREVRQMVPGHCFRSAARACVKVKR